MPNFNFPRKSNSFEQLIEIEQIDDYIQSK